MRRAALIWLWLLAIATVLVAFVVLNPPLRYAVTRLEPLGAAIVFVAACIGYGRLARGDDFPTSAALGAGIIGAATFFIALVHAIHPLVFMVLIAGGLFLLAARRPPLAARLTRATLPRACRANCCCCFFSFSLLAES